MPKLSEILRRVRESDDYRKAEVLASNDYKLVSDLVSLRKKRGLKQADVAALLGTTQQAVSKIESHDSDPKLSTLRTYANAIGAIVSHSVIPAEQHTWHAVSFVAAAAPSQPASATYSQAPRARYDYLLAA